MYDLVVSFYKKLYSIDVEKHVQEAELSAILHEPEFNLGDCVCVTHTSYVGTVVGYNRRYGGFYPGIRYPYFIRIDISGSPHFQEAVGQIFEYSAERLELV